MKLRRLDIERLTTWQTFWTPEWSPWRPWRVVLLKWHGTMLSNSTTGDEIWLSVPRFAWLVVRVWRQRRADRKLAPARIVKQWDK